MNGHIWIGTYGGGLNVVDGIFLICILFILIMD